MKKYDNNMIMIILMIMIMNIEYIWLISLNSLKIKVSPVLAYNFNQLIYAVCALPHPINFLPCPDLPREKNLPSPSLAKTKCHCHLLPQKMIQTRLSLSEGVPPHHLAHSGSFACWQLHSGLLSPPLNQSHHPTTAHFPHCRSKGLREAESGLDQ